MQRRLATKSKMSSKRPSAGKTTIYDIARSTGASPSTVSAALSGTWRSRRIKESTALEIQRLAEEQGYTTNMQARGLRKARSGLVGMVLPAVASAKTYSPGSWKSSPRPRA